MISDNNGLLCGYLYDADGERSLKINVLASNLLINSQASSSSYGMDYTIYVNPYMVWQMGGVYTKHYYIGEGRFLSSLGNESTISNPKTAAAVDLSLINAKRTQQETRLAGFLSIFGVPLSGIQSLGNGQASLSAAVANTRTVQSDMTEGRLQYYYHADHLGSTGYITGLDGTVLQHVEYIPGGEAFFEEKTGSWSTPYLFSSKELDDETGLYYFGARYYNSHLGIWMSTDPMELDYPGVSSYAYCHGNPVNRIDLWGMSDDDPPSTVSVLRNFGKGLWNSVSNTFTGLWNTVSHPINTVESVGNAVMHPVETGRAMIQSVTQTYDDFQSGDANVKAAIIGEGVGEAAKLFIGGKAVVKVGSLAKSSVKGVTRKALTNEELVNKAADKAHRAIEGTGHVVGTKKHTYATKLIDRYQSIYGDKGIITNFYFKSEYGKGFLDVYDKANNVIYDFKFGKSARMSSAQYNKYSNSFPNATIKIIKRQ